MNNCEYIEHHIKPSDALEQIVTSASELAFNRIDDQEARR